jgi:hypothetical protein
MLQVAAFAEQCRDATRLSGMQKGCCYMSVALLFIIMSVAVEPIVYRVACYVTLFHMVCSPASMLRTARHGAVLMNKCVHALCNRSVCLLR